MHKRSHLTLILPTSIKPRDWLRFVWIEPFPGQWARLKLTEEDARALEVCIMSAPQMGSVVPGTGGLRKVRFATHNADRGKSGSYRVFYVYFPDYGIVLLWAIIAKSEQDDLSKADRNAIKTQVARVKSLLDQGAIR